MNFFFAGAAESDSAGAVEVAASDCAAAASDCAALAKVVREVLWAVDAVVDAVEDAVEDAGDAEGRRRGSTRVEWRSELKWMAFISIGVSSLAPGNSLRSIIVG